MKMQEQIKCDMTEIRTNMQFLSESVTAMISSTMDEILRLFNDRKGRHVKEFGDTEAAVVGGEESHVVEEVHKIDEVGNQEPVVDRKGKGKVDPTDDATFECSLQPPSFDLGFGYTQLDVSHSAEIQKRVDAVISDVVTASANVEEEVFPFCSLCCMLVTECIGHERYTFRNTQITRIHEFMLHSFCIN
ncbi:uncharacterized protein LOC111396413 [Olea europaea var. sylvestris]|uniref:uncharacterized protein LOC111396413 n=1 Tax=Olea europaea var. sylvestris TaxID=158386 RepID=UPI000C1CEEEB|nr:uncharacterized protein LOC111396413 [Olea europaea var. sylvestris]